MNVRGQSIGREIAVCRADDGDAVLAIARNRGDLAELAGRNPTIDTLVVDATEDDAPASVFARTRPDLLVLSAGAQPPAAPLPELSRTQFAANWDVDVKGQFDF
jgi:NAD(P)-dependent dehydrogenase (short-subunit alcohol dehydrogenase family)